MLRVLATLLVLTSTVVVAGESPTVDSRLADLIERAVKETGFSINISGSTIYSVSINTINGVSVCDATSASNVKLLQDALNKQPNIKDNFGPAYYSVTTPDGTRKFLAPEQLEKQGILKGCTNIYVSVNPK